MPEEEYQSESQHQHGYQEVIQGTERDLLDVLAEQIIEEINEQSINPNDGNAKITQDKEMEDLLEEIFRQPRPSTSRSLHSDFRHPVGPTSEKDQRDEELLKALNSLELILSMENEENSGRERRSISQDQTLMEAVETIESLLSPSNRSRRSTHENKHDSQSFEAEDPEDLLDALGSLEHLMRSSSHSSRKRRSLTDPEEPSLHEEILQVYHVINKAAMKINHDSLAAINLLETAKTKLKIIAKSHRDTEPHEILRYISKRSTRVEGPIEAMTRKMVARGFNTQEYLWLSKEFDLTKEDVDEGDHIHCIIVPWHLIVIFSEEHV